MKTELKTGAAIASAIALLLGSAPAHAADKPKDGAKVKCVGGNSCKGKSECSTADNSCSGQNGCKAKGWTMADAKACKKAGGKVEEEKKPAAKSEKM
jgi:uncharacterized membrane protein